MRQNRSAINAGKVTMISAPAGLRAIPSADSERVVGCPRIRRLTAVLVQSSQRPSPDCWRTASSQAPVRLTQLLIYRSR